MKSTYLGPTNGETVTGWIYVIDLEGTEEILYPRVHTSYLITQLYVPPQHRGKGMAKAMLSELTQDADREGAELLLSFEPEEFPGSDPEQLKKLYESFGFLWDEEIHGMRRNSQK